jgi:hypothetical protein
MWWSPMPQNSSMYLWWHNLFIIGYNTCNKWVFLMRQMKLFTPSPKENIHCHWDPRQREVVFNIFSLGAQIWESLTQPLGMSTFDAFGMQVKTNFKVLLCWPNCGKRLKKPTSNGLKMTKGLNVWHQYKTFYESQSLEIVCSGFKL